MSLIKVQDTKTKKVKVLTTKQYSSITETFLSTKVTFSAFGGTKKNIQEISILINKNHITGLLRNPVK